MNKKRDHENWKKVVPKKRNTFVFLVEVSCFWRWLNFACSIARACSKRLLLFNLHEASICRVHRRRRIVMSTTLGHGADKQEAFRRMSIFKYRGARTYVAVAAANQDLQPFLPQIVLASQIRFRQHLAVVVEEEHSNCKFWRESSGWNSSERMVRIFHF